MAVTRENLHGQAWAVEFHVGFPFSGANIATEQRGPIAVAFLPVFISTLLLIPVVLTEHARRDRSGGSRVA